MHETSCMFDNQLVQKVIFQTPSPPLGYTLYKQRVC